MERESNWNTEQHTALRINETSVNSTITTADIVTL